VGGVIGLLKDGDIIRMDAEVGTLDVKLTDVELAARKKDWTPRAPQLSIRGHLEICARVGPARHGAVTHPGARMKPMFLPTCRRF
jgi:dihydroxy-acid dehydratase